MALLSKFFGRTASEGAAFALGTAVGPALSPAVRELVNEAWHLYPTRPVDAALLAEGVARRHLPREWAVTEASYTGIDSDRFDRMVAAFSAGPGVAVAFQLWRRGVIDEAGFREAAGREGIEAAWISDLVKLRDVLLSPQDLAMARQQGFIDQGRQYAEAELQGVTNERAELMFQMAGLPPGIEAANAMLHRGIITEAEFSQIVREGHIKTKYTDELLRLSHPVLTPIQAATLRLKGWITEAQAADLGALSGYTAAQMEQLYLMQGRPMAPVQMYTAWAREASGPQGGTFDKADFLRAIRQSDIRPEYGEPLWDIRFAYPSLFQLRRLAEDGALDRAELLDILHKERYPDGLAVKIVDGWLRGAGTTAKGLTQADLTAEYEGLFLTRSSFIAGLKELGYSADDAAGKADAVDAKRVRTSRTALIARIHAQYVNHRISRDAATGALDRAAVPARVRDLLMPDWDLERELTADALTAAQIKKAVGAGLMTRTEGLRRLEWKGYEAPDAAIYLDE